MPATPARKQPAKKAAARKAPAKKAAAKKVAAKKTTAAAPAAPVKASARALTSFQEKFAKRFGEGSIRRANETRAYRFVSTGSLTLDDAMGGGWVVGRIAEIWGPESVAKTTVVYHGIANFQREFPDLMAGFIDMERTFDKDWAAKQGVDIDRLFVVVPRTSEDVSDMARQMVESRLYSVVALDSVGGMITNEEMNNDAEKASMGTAAKVITRMVKQCAVLCDETGTTLLIVNQVRAILDARNSGDTTGGGKALKHVTTHKIRLRRTNDDPFYVGTGEDRELVGFTVAAIVEKNKIAPPRRVANFALFNQETVEYGPVGIDKAREAFTIGKRLGVIQEVSSGRFLMPGDEEKPIHGAPKAMQRLREDVAMLDVIRAKLTELRANKLVAEVPIDGTETVDDEPDAPLINVVTGEVVEVAKSWEGFEQDPNAPLDFSGRTTQADGNSVALDQMRDTELSEAVAGAQ